MICNECCQYKSDEMLSCRCTNPKQIGARYLGLVSGCVFLHSDGSRCKKKVLDDLYVCNEHDQTKKQKQKPRTTTKTEKSETEVSKTTTKTKTKTKTKKTVVL